MSELDKLDKLEKIVKNADDSALTVALSNLISGIIIAFAILMAAFIITCSFIWGWMGFAIIVGIFGLVLGLILIGRDE